MDALGVHAPHLQKFGDALRGPLCVAENHGPVVVPAVHNSGDGLCLAVIADLQSVLEDVRFVLLVRLDGNLLRVPLIDPGNIQHLTGDRCGEHAQILPLVHPVQQAGHIMDKAHVQHPVRLVQHHRLGGVHPDRAALHVVRQAARRGDDDLGLPLQNINLLADGLSAVKAHHPNAGTERRDVPQLVGDLDSQLPGGRQNDRLNGLVLRGNVFHNGNPVCEGLAGAGGSLCDHVLPRQHRGDTPGLHGGGELDIALFNGTHDLRRQSKTLEPDALCQFHKLFFPFPISFFSVSGPDRGAVLHFCYKSLLLYPLWRNL
ncbi:hypothetical protein SDC9_77049 [bioreactor metagenome]|uniref:Uncharacterized protein n=1 Tax=bioreactor metagenome TaxID=1076179 RepID=A0A644YQA6_9ZZZZ